MNVLFDTNVILDLMLERKPFFVEAALLISSVESGVITGFLSATTITTLHYLAAKAIGEKEARKKLVYLFELFEIAPVNRVVLQEAMQLKFSDFEDAVIHETAVHSGVSAIVTRDTEGFKKASIPVYSPSQLVSALQILNK